VRTTDGPLDKAKPSRSEGVPPSIPRVHFRQWIAAFVAAVPRRSLSRFNLVMTAWAQRHHVRRFKPDRRMVGHLHLVVHMQLAFARQEAAALFAPVFSPMPRDAAGFLPSEGTVKPTARVRHDGPSLTGCDCNQYRRRVFLLQ
jgi:hypothetical protein